MGPWFKHIAQCEKVVRFLVLVRETLEFHILSWTSCSVYAPEFSLSFSPLSYVVLTSVFHRFYRLSSFFAVLIDILHIKKKFNRGSYFQPLTLGWSAASLSLRYNRTWINGKIEQKLKTKKIKRQPKIVISVNTTLSVFCAPYLPSLQYCKCWKRQRRKHELPTYFRAYMPFGLACACERGKNGGRITWFR